MRIYCHNNKQSTLVHYTSCKTVQAERLDIYRDFGHLPYLPVYNVHLCIIRTPILDCILGKKKKGGEQKTEEVVTQN